MTTRIRNLLHGVEVKMSPVHGTFKQAQKVRQVPEGQQMALDFGARGEE